MASTDLAFDPTHVNLTDPGFDLRQLICYVNGEENEYNGNIGARISSIFVILFVSTAFTFFPVVATRAPRLRIPLSVYQFSRYFGAGVIIATAFIHLLDPAYEAIGPASCVGMTEGWVGYTWCPALVLTSVMVIFLVDLAAERYVEMKYGVSDHENIEQLITANARGTVVPVTTASRPDAMGGKDDLEQAAIQEELGERMEKIAFQQQLAAFLILEFGIIFHSVIIGLNLGVVGDEFSVLYPVLVFHQSFEGLGIGARLSAISFPRHYRWMPSALCIAYGFTTPVSIAVGLGVRTTYNPGSFTANVVSGVLDSISAGILIYTGLVELLARDFLFNLRNARDGKKLTFKIICLLLGTGIMALLGKWA
ncbi:ZIP zinc/iron transport family [Trematosphaeria pertusa]|uniref:ZIP zinc/iron transport family n=1 Tax=Trematosphaeria pertusa TaxID=390896 RepID=A0A6A6IAV9_9PLEO|nr:ZIP zinc/iron transport family [Trematosphaeria pertusa]KAF2247347.1 ZIP zinc/iron transport family [Trematosphaeria pertusa]